MTLSCNVECDSHDLPAKQSDLTVSLSSSTEFHLHPATGTFVRSFSFAWSTIKYGLFARSTAQSNKSSAAEGAVHELPSIEKITLYLVRSEILATLLSCGELVRLPGSREDDELFLHSPGQRRRRVRRIRSLDGAADLWPREYPPAPRASCGSWLCLLQFSSSESVVGGKRCASVLTEAVEDPEQQPDESRVVSVASERSAEELRPCAGCFGRGT